MAELIDITRALDKVQDFNRVQRMLLLSAGTLQTALSAYFGREVTVQVIEQTVDGNGVIRRLAHLHEGRVVACVATSQLTIEREDVREQVLAQSMGIGQVLETLGVHPSFELDQVRRTRDHFSRIYTLRSPGVVYVIREEFPQSLYQPSAWGDV